MPFRAFTMPTASRSVVRCASAAFHGPAPRPPASRPLSSHLLARGAISVGSRVFVAIEGSPDRCVVFGASPWDGMERLESLGGGMGRDAMRSVGVRCLG